MEEEKKFQFGWTKPKLKPFCEIMRMLRDKRDWSLRDLRKRVPIDLGRLSDLDLGKAEPTRDEVFSLAEILCSTANEAANLIAMWDEEHGYGEGAQ